jgi:hypothetical protein
MEKTPFEQWNDGRFNLNSTPEELQGIAWCAALHWAKGEIIRQHGKESTLVKNITKIIDGGMK